MNRSRATHYLLCLALLFGVLSGLLGGSVALAAQKNSNDAFSLPPSQEEPLPEEPPPEEKLTLVPRYPILKAESGRTFEFEVSLSYQGSEPRAFEFDLTVPTGWIGIIAPSYSEGGEQLLSITLEPEKTYADKVNIIIIPPPGELPEPGDYVTTFKVGSGDLRESVELTAVVTEIPPTYQFYMTTATGRLNMNAKAGADNHLTVGLKNIGTGVCKNIALSSVKSEGWSVTFTPYRVESLEPGLSQEIDVVITPPSKTIAGDYHVSLRAIGEKASDSIELRTTVVTPTIWGGAGIGIAVAVIAGLAVLFRRLGRR